MTASPKTICILRLSAIGDVCHAVAAVQAIQRHNPEAKITWVIGKVEYQLLKNLPGVEFVIFEKSKGKEAFTLLKKALGKRVFDVLLHMQVAFRANWATRFIQAKRKVGFDWGRSKELHSLFIGERIKSQKEPHVLEGFFGFAQLVGVPEEELNNLTWDIPVSDKDKAFAQQRIGEGKQLIIAPAASKKERNWLPERYAEIAEYAASKGFTVSLCGGPGPLDKETADAIKQHCNVELNDFVGQTTLKQMLAMLARASLVIAPDTGPAHMAVTQRTPVLGLYAHSNPGRTGPYLYQDYVCSAYEQHVSAQQGKPVEKLKWGTRAKGADLMQSITVDQVKQTFDLICKDFEL